MTPLRIGLLLTAVLLGPSLWSQVQAGSMDGSTALQRAGLVAVAITAGALGIQRLIRDYDKEQERARALTENLDDKVHEGRTLSGTGNPQPQRPPGNPQPQRPPGNPQPQRPGPDFPQGQGPAGEPPATGSPEQGLGDRPAPDGAGTLPGAAAQNLAAPNLAAAGPTIPGTAVQGPPESGPPPGQGVPQGPGAPPGQVPRPRGSV